MLKRVLFILLLTLFSLQLKSQTIIQMESSGGVYKVPCTINGLQLKFIFDTGASSVSLSSSIANMMLDNGYLSRDDIRGSAASILADGSIIDHTKVVIRELVIAGKTIKNVDAVVLHNQSAPLLLGQSAIQRLGKVSIEGNKLIINEFIKEAETTILSNKEKSDLVSEALALAEDSQYANAVKLFQRAEKAEWIFDYYEYKSYANAKRMIKEYDDALKMYVHMLNNASAFGITKKCRADIYIDMGRIYYDLSSYESAIEYCSKAERLCEFPLFPWETAIYYMANSYIKMGEMYSALTTYEKALKKYFNYMEISALDCWKKDYKDPIVANLYIYLHWFYSTEGAYYDSNQKKKYAIISAAWGDKDAIEWCRKVQLSYNEQPYVYEY